MISCARSDSLPKPEKPAGHRSPGAPDMKRRHLLIAVSTLVLASLGGAPAVSAHTLVDPTTLTPPLKPFRICYEDGPWVKCDTSGVTTFVNEPAGFELSCGTVYLTATETTHATRWYQAGLLVERNANESMRGFWSLSPVGTGPTVDVAADFSWHEHFVVPGDLSSDVEVSHGNYIRVEGLGAIGMDSGTFKADGTFRGHAGENVPQEDPALCALLGA
jgi:hypothetical protein